MKQTLLFSILLFLLQTLNGQICAGPNTAVSEVNEDIGTANNWGLGNSFSSNNVYNLGPTLSAAGSFSNRLKLTNFGFSVPANATIRGIELMVERSVTGSTIEDYDVMLVKAGVTQTAHDKAVAGAWPAADATATYGSSTDLWANVWTPADINNSGFGVAIAAIRNISSGPPREPRIDFVTLRVCYDIILPLGIRSFTATVTSGNSVQLNWVTSNEESVRFISVEKSSNGLQYNRLASLLPKGNGVIGEQPYNFTDPFVKSGTNYYRLRITDIDNRETLSEIRTASVEAGNGKEKLLRYFNRTVFVHPLLEPGNYQLQLTNMLGQIIYTRSFTALPGALINLSLPEQKKGIYLLLLKGTKRAETIKITF